MKNKTQVDVEIPCRSGKSNLYLWMGGQQFSPSVREKIPVDILKDKDILFVGSCADTLGSILGKTPMKFDVIIDRAKLAKTA